MKSMESHHCLEVIIVPDTFKNVSSNQHFILGYQNNVVFYPGPVPPLGTKDSLLKIKANALLSFGQKFWRHFG